MNDTREAFELVWLTLPVPGEFDAMDVCDQDRWRDVVEAAFLAGRASMAKVPKQIKEALEIGYELAVAEAARTHDALAGYQPGKHAAADKDVQTIHAAMELLSTLPKDDTQADIGGDEWLDSRDFYEAMQGYRCAPLDNQREVIANFENVKRLIRERFASSQPTSSIPAAHVAPFKYYKEENLFMIQGNEYVLVPNEAAKDLLRIAPNLCTEVGFRIFKPK